MQQTHHTYNDFHLGDNLAHLHFLRHLAAGNPTHRFIHAAHECHLAQLREFVEDVPTIELIRIEDRSPNAINTWKNAGGYFERSPLRNQYWDFHLAWFRNLSGQMGVWSPFEQVTDLLLGGPALQRRGDTYRGKQWNILVINSRPCSGQLLKYDRLDYFDPLLRELVAAGFAVLCTQKTEVPGVDCTEDLFGERMSLLQIGQASLCCDHHIMVSTGPSWPVLNRCNLLDQTGQLGLHVLLIGNGERLDHEDLNLLQVDSLEACRALLVERRFLV